MMPIPGQQVQLIFKNGTRIEGVVESWSPGLSVLRSLIGPNKMLVHQTQQEVLLTQIILEPQENVAPIDPVEMVEDPIPDPPIVHVQPTELSPTQLRTQKLVELRKMQKQIEQEDVRAKLTTFTISAPNPELFYKTPNLLGNVKMPGAAIKPKLK